MAAPRYRRAGNRERFLAYGSLTIFAAGVAILVQLALVKPQNEPSIVVYCAVALRLPVAAAAKAFTAETGTAVRIEYGASGELEGKLRLDRQNQRPTADLLIPADDSFAARAAAEGLTTTSVPVATMRLVLAHHPDLPDPPANLADLLASNLAYAVCDQSAGAGLATAEAFADQFPAVQEQAKTTFPRVTEAAGAVATSDPLAAAFIWDVTARQFQLTISDFRELAGATTSISANLVPDGPNAPAALQFANFLASAPASRRAFEQHGFGLPAPAAP